MKTKAIIMALAMIILVACGNSSSDPAADQEPRSAPDLPGQGYDQALERARNVEQDVLDAAERQREAIEDQEGGG